MISGDSEAAVLEAAALVPDLRATHFYDPHHHAGRAVAAAIGASGQIAWDMFVFFDPENPGAASTAPASSPFPRPDAWFHQLRGRDWAGGERYRWGEDLARSLSEEAAMRWRPPA